MALRSASPDNFVPSTVTERGTSHWFASLRNTMTLPVTLNMTMYRLSASASQVWMRASQRRGGRMPESFFVSGGLSIIGGTIYRAFRRVASRHAANDHVACPNNSAFATSRYWP
jgi:hypothetical protein